MKLTEKENERTAGGLKIPNSNSLDGIGQNAFTLVPQSEFDDLKKRINSANETLKNLEQTRKTNKIELDQNRLLKNENDILRQQVDKLRDPMEAANSLVEPWTQLMDPVKTATFENITLLHKMSYRRSEDELRSISIILDAIR